MESKEKTIKKLNKVFRIGYLPSRGNQHYTPKTQGLVNCFEHACFNLTNKQLLSFNFNFEDSLSFRYFYMNNCSQEKAQQDFIDFIKATGLKVRICDYEEKVGPQSWKVALYFTNPSWLGCQDFHFYLQRPNGKWSAKRGFSKYLENEVDIDIIMQNYRYFNMLEISNPYDGKMRISGWTKKSFGDFPNNFKKNQQKESGVINLTEKEKQL